MDEEKSSGLSPWLGLWVGFWVLVAVGPAFRGVSEEILDNMVAGILFVGMLPSAIAVMVVGLLAGSVLRRVNPPTGPRAGWGRFTVFVLAGGAGAGAWSVGTLVAPLLSPGYVETFGQVGELSYPMSLIGLLIGLAFGAKALLDIEKDMEADRQKPQEKTGDGA